MSESPGWLLLHAMCVARTATFVGDSQDSRVEERRRAALAATRELRERLFVYRPALDYKRTTKMTLTPSRYKESVLLAALQDRHIRTARKCPLLRPISLASPHHLSARLPASRHST